MGMPSEHWKSEILELKRSGLPVPEICIQLGTSKSTVYRVLEELDSQKEFRRGYDRLDLESRKDEIISLYQTGVGTVLIARYLGVKSTSRNAISDFLRSNGIEIRGVKQSRLTKYVDTIQELYLGRKSSLQISRELGIAKCAVLKILHDSGITIRSIKKPAKRSRRERDALFLKHQESINKSAGYWYGFYKDIGVPFAEFRQAAWIAALRAAEIFDNDGKAQFPTYASIWVKFAIIQLVKEEMRHRHSELIEKLH